MSNKRREVIRKIAEDGGTPFEDCLAYYEQDKTKGYSGEPLTDNELLEAARDLGIKL